MNTLLTIRPFGFAPVPALPPFLLLPESMEVQATVQINRAVSVKPLVPEMLLILYRKALFNSTQIVAKQPLLSQLWVYRIERRPFIGP